MNMDKSPIALTEYEYSILKNNHIISMCCARQLKSATINEEGIELSLTFEELENLIGYVAAAESNHAHTRRKQEDLGSICDYLESFKNDIKFSWRDERFQIVKVIQDPVDLVQEIEN